MKTIYSTFFVQCTNCLCLSVVGKVIHSSLIGFRLLPPPSVHAEYQCELTSCEANEGQDGAGIAVFTFTTV